MKCPAAGSLRGLHHYTAQFLTIILVLHLMLVVINGYLQISARSQFLGRPRAAPGGPADGPHRLSIAVGPKRFRCHQSCRQPAQCRAGDRSDSPARPHRRPRLRQPDPHPLLRHSRRRPARRHHSAAGYPILPLPTPRFCRRQIPSPTSTPRSGPIRPCATPIVCLAFAAAMLVLTIKYGSANSPRRPMPPNPSPPRVRNGPSCSCSSS